MFAISFSFNINGNISIYLVGKTWFLSALYIQVYTCVLMLYGLKLCLLPSVTVLAAQDYILFLLGFFLCVTVLGCQIWNIVYMKRICAMFNTLIQLNRVMGE